MDRGPRLYLPSNVALWYGDGGQSGFDSAAKPDCRYPVGRWLEPCRFLDFGGFYLDTLYSPKHESTLLGGSSIDSKASGGKDVKDDEPSEGRREWLSVMLFLGITATSFSALLEWPRYQLLLGRDAFDVGLFEKALILWTLCAKSLLIFVPLLPFLALIISLGYMRVERFLLLTIWTLVFYALLVDILLLGLTGGHLFDFFPRVIDMILGGDGSHFQWAGEYVLLQAWCGLICVVLTGLAVFRMCRWITFRLRQPLRDKTGMVITTVFTASFIIFVVGGMAGHAFLKSSALIVGIDSALPFPNPFVEIVQQRMGDLVASRTRAPMLHTLVVAPKEFSKSELRQEVMTLHNLTIGKIDLEGCQIRDSEGTILLLSGNLAPGSMASLVWPRQITTRMRWFVTDRKGMVRYQLKRLGAAFRRDLAFCREGTIAESSSINLESTITSIRDRYLPAIADPKPTEIAPFKRRANSPNVIVMVLESLNHLKFNRELIPKIYAWSDSGLRLKHHYSGSNISHWGFFSLFYSRIPIAYEPTLDRKIPPPLPEIFARSGYTTVYVAGGHHEGWARMDDFVNDRAFSEMYICDDSGADSPSGSPVRPKSNTPSKPHAYDSSEVAFSRWCHSDRMALAKTLSVLETGTHRPYFVFVYLLASRFPYAFLPHCRSFSPCENVPVLLNDQTRLLNRYRNGLICMEEAVMEFVEKLDPNRDLVIVTADHGESLGEDGIKFHGTRASEAQLRVPFMMVGPGIDAARIDVPTSHLDVLPTLIHAVSGESVKGRDFHGRDLLCKEFSDEPVFVSATPRKNQVVMIRNGEKFSFRINPGEKTALDIVFEGLLNDDGLFHQDPTNERQRLGK